jgi:erythromycin esterase-like protein
LERRSTVVRIFSASNRLFQPLVEAHGYSAVAIKSSFPRTRVVNEYHYVSVARQLLNYHAALARDSTDPGVSV